MTSLLVVNIIGQNPVLEQILARTPGLSLRGFAFEFTFVGHTSPDKRKKRGENRFVNEWFALATLAQRKI